MRIFGKRIASLVLVICMLASSVMVVGASTTGQFKDFPNNWSTQAVTAAVDNGLLHGYEDNTIRTEGVLTRAEMATVINNAFGAVIEGNISEYKDVNPGTWYYKAIAKGVNMGTFVGGSNGYMFPDNPITREEAFAVIARALVLPAGDSASLDKFTDKDSISSWAVTSLAALASRGYINGDDKSRINPKNNITRAEFAVLMNNIVRNYYTEANSTYTGTVEGTVMVNVGGVKLSNMVINGDLIIGDGVHTYNITLENVTVNGRILVRGAQKPGKITISKSTVRDGIVVNNVNGTVYFDNYKSDIFFVNLSDNTSVEFKKPHSGGGSSSSGGNPPETTSFVVSFVDGETLVAEYKVPEGDTIESLGKDMPDVKETYSAAESSANDYNHDVYRLGWFDENRIEYKKDTPINSNVTLHPGWKELSAKMSTTRFNIPDVYINLFYNPDGKVIDTATDLVFGNRLIALNGLNQFENKFFEQPQIQRFITPDKKIKMVNLDMSFGDLFGSKEAFKSLFKDQIDTALGSVPESVRGQIEDKIDEALEQIAVEKIWNLNEGVIDLAMPLSQIFGSEDNLRKMLKEATNGVLDSVPSDIRDDIQEELDNVIEFIVKSDATASLPQDTMTNIHDTMTLSEFFGGSEAFAAMLKQGADDIIGSSVPADMQGDVRVALYSAIDTISTQSTWNINDSNANKNINVKLTLNSLFGGESAFAQMMNDALDAAIAGIEDEAIKNEIRTKVGGVLNTLAAKTEWSLNDSDGKTTIVISDKPIADLLGGQNEMSTLIKSEIANKIASLPPLVKTEVENSVYPVVDELVSQSAWQLGNAAGKADIDIDIKLDDVFGGEGTFANKVKTAINNKLNELPAIYRNQISADILAAVDNILTSESWTNNNSAGNASLNLTLKAEDLFISQGSFESIINSKIDSMLADMPDSVKTAFEEQINPVVESLISAPIWQINNSAYTRNVTVNLTPADILGDDIASDLKNEIYDKLNSLPDNVVFNKTDDEIAEMFVGLLESNAWNYNNSDNIIGASASIPVYEAFGGSKDAFAGEIKSAISTEISDLSAYNQAIVNNTVTAIANSDTWSSNYSDGFADLKFTIKIKDFIDKTELNNISTLPGGAEIAEAITNGGNIHVTLDNVNVVNALMEQINSAQFNSSMNDEIAAVVALVGDEEVKAVFDEIKGEYVDTLQSAIDAVIGGELTVPVPSVIEKEKTININEIFLNKIKTQLDSVSYGDIKNSISAIIGVVGSLETEFDAAKSAFISDIDDALAGSEIDSSFVLDLSLNVNKLFLETIRTFVDSTTYTDITTAYPSLGNFVTSDMFDTAKNDYLRDIDKALGPEHTPMSTVLSMTTTVNVAKIMTEKLQEVVDGLSYSDLGIDADTEAIVGSGIADKFDEVKTDYLNRISNTLTSGADLVNEVEFTFDVNVNKLFLDGMYKEVDGTTYNSIKNNLETMLGSELIDMVGESNIESAFKDSKREYLDEINAAIENSENSVDDSISFATTIDVTKLLLQGLLTKVETIEYSEVSGYLPAELVNIIDDDVALETSFNNAMDAYEASINAAIQYGDELRNVISISVDVNVNKILMNQMNSKISNITFDDVEDKINADIKEFIGEELEDAFLAAKESYADKVADVLNAKTQTLDNNIELDVQVNMIELIIKGLDEKLATITYDDVKNQIDDSIKKALGEEVEAAVNAALDTYRERIDAITAEGSTITTFDTSYTLDIQVNITKLVIDGLIDKLTDLTFDEVLEIIDQSMVKLLDEEYLSDQFDVAKKNMLDGINEAVASGEPLAGDIFHLMLQLDVYELLLKEIDKRIETMDYDSISSKIPDNIKKLLGEDIIKNEYNEVIEDFAQRVEYALENDTDTLDCSLIISINPIDDILKPLYSKYTAEMADRLGAYYTENQDLVKIKEIMGLDNLLVKEGNETEELSGYKLKSNDKYYDIIEQVVLLSDGAINTFSDAAGESGNLEELVSLYVDLGYTYYKKVIEMAKTALEYTGRDIDIDSILPSDETIEGQRENTKKYATALVKNPDLTTKEVIVNGLNLIGADADRWGEFEKTITKSQETIKIKNRTYIPDLDNN